MPPDSQRDGSYLTCIASAVSDTTVDLSHLLDLPVHQRDIRTATSPHGTSCNRPRGDRHVKQLHPVALPPSVQDTSTTTLRLLCAFSLFNISSLTVMPPLRIANALPICYPWSPTTKRPDCHFSVFDSGVSLSGTQPNPPTLIPETNVLTFLSSTPIGLDTTLHDSITDLISLLLRPMLDRQILPCHICPTFASLSHFNARALVEVLHVLRLFEASGRNFGSTHQPHRINRGKKAVTNGYPSTWVLSEFHVSNAPTVTRPASHAGKKKQVIPIEVMDPRMQICTPVTLSRIDAMMRCSPTLFCFFLQPHSGGHKPDSVLFFSTACSCIRYAAILFNHWRELIWYSKCDVLNGQKAQMHQYIFAHLFYCVTSLKTKNKNSGASLRCIRDHLTLTGAVSPFDSAEKWTRESIPHPQSMQENS
ncbi:hypothetical protein GMOD_00003961 [Pyrenophora seminiperda CCB06]|uniref:Uncharacterized protein n=1 Tax=Pyrenophora seminiperda CCB06 TaxID=1302712 RepID=A0A3M7M0C2_9PLEO|nr:hypothetical protein GMOD_00003961 [Pyrenophora seminiperda CCB06]